MRRALEALWYARPMRRVRPLRSFLMAVLAFTPLGVYLLACSGDDSTSPAATSTLDGSPGSSSGNLGDGSTGNNDTSTGTDSGGGDGQSNPDGSIIRGPVSMDFDPSGTGDPISMTWDDTTSQLYIADNQNNQLWTWTVAAGFKKLVQVPDDVGALAAMDTNMGQIVKLPDGTLVVPRFGFGTKGGIVYVNPTTNAKGDVPDASLTKKRTALANATVLGAGNMFGAYFFNANGDDAGVVTKVTLDGEINYAFGLQKPVGVIVLNDQLIVSEQTRGVLYAIAIDGGPGSVAPYTVYAQVPSPDALTQGPGDSLITGQFRPLSDGGPLQLRQIFSDGGFQVIEADGGLSKPQGVAYDKTNKRLFVADSNGTTIRTIKIFPLE